MPLEILGWKSAGILPARLVAGVDPGKVGQTGADDDHFTAASLAGGLAQGPGLLIAARVIQGVGAAALASSSLSLITAGHPEGPARTRALSVWTAAGGSAGAVGVVLGGLLTTGLSWRYVLFINVPIGIALLAAAAASLVPSPPRRDGARLDLPGVLTVTAGAGSWSTASPRPASGSGDRLPSSRPWPPPRSC